MKKLYDTFKKGTVVKMTLEEKATMRTRLLAYMNKATTPSPYQSVVSPYTPRFSFKVMHLAKMVALVLVIVLIGGETLAYASQDALPGDGFLYSVKVNVAEEITATFKVSHEEKIAWISERMDRRIEEVKTLKEENNLTPENEKIVTHAFLDHTKALDEDLAELEASGKSEVVVAIADDLIPKLDTYEKVINEVPVATTIALLPDQDNVRKINGDEISSTPPEEIEPSTTTLSILTEDPTVPDNGGADLTESDSTDSNDASNEETTDSNIDTSPALGDLIRLQRSVLQAKKEVALDNIDEESPTAEIQDEVLLTGTLSGRVSIAGALYECLSPENALPGIPLNCTSTNPNLFTNREIKIYQDNALVTTIDLSRTGPQFSVSLPVGSYDVVYSGTPSDKIQKEKQTITIEADSTSTYTNLVIPLENRDHTGEGVIAGTVVVTTPCQSSDGALSCTEELVSKKPGISILISEVASAKVLKTVPIKTDGSFNVTMPNGTYTLTVVETSPLPKATPLHRFTSIPTTLSVYGYETKTIQITALLIQ